jgi:hypothetical protein
MHIHNTQPHPEHLTPELQPTQQAYDHYLGGAVLAAESVVFPGDTAPVSAYTTIVAPPHVGQTADMASSLPRKASSEAHETPGSTPPAAAEGCDPPQKPPIPPGTSSSEQEPDQPPSEAVRLLQSKLPPRSAQEWQTMLQRPGETPEDLDVLVARAMEREAEARAAALQKLEELAATDEQKIAYVHDICAASENITPAGDRLQPHTITNLVAAAPTIEHAAIYKAYAQRWRDTLQQGPYQANAFVTEATFGQYITQITEHAAQSGAIPAPEVMADIFDTLTTFQADIQATDDEYLYMIQDSFVEHVLERVADQAYTTASGSEYRNMSAFAKTVIAARQVAPIAAHAALSTAQKYAACRLDDAAHQGMLRLLGDLVSNSSESKLLTHQLFYESGIGSISEFIYTAYTAELSAGTVNELIMRFKASHPTANEETFIRSISTAIQLSPVFPEVREAVHRQEAYTHEALEAMIRFYDTGDTTHLTPNILALIGPAGADRSAYDQPITIFDDTGSMMRTPERQVPAIKLLRRLEADTRAVLEQPPHTSNPKLAAALEAVHTADPAQKREALQQALAVVNGDLATRLTTRAVGLQPSHVAALAWLEREGAKAVRGIGSFEEQLGSHREPWLQEVVRFHMLTTSADSYTPEQIDIFIDNLAKGSAAEAYRQISKYTVSNLATLAKRYPAATTGFLWTGTPAGALLELVDWKPPTTAVGKRLYEDWTKPEYRRRSGD